jgi:parallel beta-helix repeat protein
MNKKNLFSIAALALAIVLLTACPSEGGSGGGGGGGDTGPVTTTTVFRNADTELTITQTTSRSARALANGSGTYVLKDLTTLGTKSEGAVTISGGGVTLRFTPRTSGQQAFTVTITGGKIGDITITVTGGSTITISGLAELSGDALKADDLARAINGMEGQSGGSVGRVEANGATVKITGGFVDFRADITVPAGVTLDVTESGVLALLHNVTLTVNGTVNAVSGYLQLEDSADWGTINGSGTINLRGQGSLFHVSRNRNKPTRTLTIDGVTLVGVNDNFDPLVSVGVGGVFVLKSGTITGNSSTGAGGGVLVHNSNYIDWSGNPVEGSGTFIMYGGTISGNTVGNGGGGGVRVCDSGSTFTLKGGTISGNTASSGGGGVDVCNSAEFTLEGGTISGNTAGNGGGVQVEPSGKFTMRGGTISGNSAYNNGGGVSVWDTGEFTMEGGTIYGKAGSLPAGTDASLANSAQNDAALSVNQATAKWGTGGTYTNGSTTGTGGTDIGSTDETLIATP